MDYHTPIAQEFHPCVLSNRTKKEVVYNFWRYRTETLQLVKKSPAYHCIVLSKTCPSVVVQTANLSLMQCYFAIPSRVMVLHLFIFSNHLDQDIRGNS